MAGLLSCGDCGGPIVRKTQTSSGKQLDYYVCGNHKNTGVCSCHSISKKQLESVLRTISNAPMRRYSMRKAQEQMLKVESDIERYRRLKIAAYGDMKDGLLTKEDSTVLL